MNTSGYTCMYNETKTSMDIHIAFIFHCSPQARFSVIPNLEIHKLDVLYMSHTPCIMYIPNTQPKNYLREFIKKFTGTLYSSGPTRIGTPLLPNNSIRITVFFWWGGLNAFIHVYCFSAEHSFLIGQVSICVQCACPLQEGPQHTISTQWSVLVHPPFSICQPPFWDQTPVMPLYFQRKKVKSLVFLLPWLHLSPEFLPPVNTCLYFALHIV